MGLREKITETARLQAWPGTIPVTFLSTAGVAGERFFTVLRERGRLAVTRCPECGTTYLPPRIYCPRDFQDLAARWDDVEARGTVHTFTVIHRDLEGRPLEKPQIFGFVWIDGTDGGLLVPLDLDPADVRIGQRVGAVLRPARARRGTIRDIISFK